jgi:AcrR family transcriptional regulator
MGERAVERLPRGRHRLTRAQVADVQRARMMTAMADAMTERGYVGTTVGDVLARAGVSRETFYQQFSSKLDCFMSAFDAAAALLFARVRKATAAPGAGSPLDDFDAVFTAYLDSLIAEPAYARLFLVEVNAAGPEAIERRAEVQAQVVDTVVQVLAVDDERGRFACRVLVAAISTMVVVPLVRGDLDALRELREPVLDLVAHVRNAQEASR